MADRSHTRVEITGEGPVLIYGPVELFTPDGRRVCSERAVTALCACRRSCRYPICDTSHRRATRNRLRKTDDAHDNAIKEDRQR
ncbi:CDGSH iron-sulfur domain-containing protein [Saccharopolyspora sp. NPDC050642]|uniref:CDGSH iron-sulfur domain-containing protein n=1 Tax=Saccharopolyspora sp. NPDC050642 TaxID=3157099 RepID=UPI0033D3D7EF